jgi:serine/threonine-protein kinase
MIGKIISHYKILEKLGEGGMGVVYKAEDMKLKREVAIKFLPERVADDSSAYQRFKIEAQAAAALNHPNIATIYAIEEEDDKTFIVMEYVKGQSLKEKIDSGVLEIDKALDIAIQISQGLAKAHEKGIIHRDIKPSNIIVSDDGVAKILDFGLAKIAEETIVTKEGTTLGTVAYMSPEQTRGEKVDNRTDI